MRSRWRLDRIWSISTEVSKTTTSLIVSSEFPFAAVFLHQLFEPLQADDFLQRHVDGFCAGLDAENADCFVREFGVEPDRGKGDGHGDSPVYIDCSYCIYQVKWRFTLSAGLTGRRSHVSSSANSRPPTVNFSQMGACDGEKKPSRQPAMKSMGMIPETRRVASRPPCATESFQRSPPGKSRAWPRRNPAPPAMRMAGSSSEPWAATKLHSSSDMSYWWQAAPMTPSIMPLKNR